jgi:DNA-binding LacI/PurR family transcriptional regulator
MADKPTLKSLSKATGIDPSLISRVLRGAKDARVSVDKRQLILRTAREAGYRPDRMGSSLRSRSSKVVALLTPDITNPFHSLLFRGAESTARLAGYEVILCHVPDAGQGGEQIESVTRSLVDGVLVACAWQPDPRLEVLRSSALPYVVINRPSGEAQDVQFLPDDTATGALAATSVIEHGHRKIVAAFSDMRMGSMRLRRQAFVDTALALDPSCQLSIRDDIKDPVEIRALIQELAANAPQDRPTALFVAHSQYAAVVVEEAVLRHRLRIPDDLAVLGYGADFDSAISSLFVPAEKIGADGMRALIGMITGAPPTLSRTYAPVLNCGTTLAMCHAGKKTAANVHIPTGLQQQS